MQELVYALRFRGEARHIGIDGNVLKTATTAPACTIRSRVGIEGLWGALHANHGAEAICESELVFTGETAFQEAGTIRFGPGCHQLHFSTIGNAVLGPAKDDKSRHGAAIWRVDGGEGRFAGATGLIASVFIVTDAGEVADHQLGVVYVR